MKIKDVCGETGLTEKAVRFYVERGLLLPHSDWRNGRTYFAFTSQDVDRLRDIACLRKAGFSIDALQEMIRHPERTGTLVQDHVKALAEEHKRAALALETLCHLGERPLTGLAELAQALRQGVPATPSHSDTAPSPPDFARFDDVSTEQREQGWLDFLVHNELRNRRERWLRLPRIAAKALLLCAALLAVAYGISCIPRPIERRWDAVQMHVAEGHMVTLVQIHIHGKLYRRLFQLAHFYGTVEIDNMPLSKDYTVEMEFLAGRSSQQSTLCYFGIPKNSSGEVLPMLMNYSMVDMKGDFQSIVLRPFEPPLADSGSTSDLIVCAPARTAEDALTLVNEMGLQDWAITNQQSDWQ